MIYIQSYHSGVVGPVQVRKKIPARESLERPLVFMRRWLSASVVTTALSLTVLLVCFSLDSDSDMTSVQVDRSVCMLQYAWGVSPGSPGVVPHTSQRTRRLPAIMLAVALVTSPIVAFGS